MHIAITGSSGFIGTALKTSLEGDGHQVTAVARTVRGGDEILWDPEAGTIDAARLEGLDAVVHLAGEPIAAGPWTTKQRAKIKHSRSNGTKLLAQALANASRPPSVLVSGSAIGYYGDRADERLTEESPAGSGFLPEVCSAWEAATAPAADAGVRVVMIRTGIVLDRSGGALAKQLPIFRMGLGGKAGRGDQWMAWITLHDQVRAIRHAIDTEISGPLNLTAPNPVTNAQFTKALGTVLHRPTRLRIPRIVRRAPAGVGALMESLLFTSARVEPAALVASGFTFDHAEIELALDAVT